MLYRPVGQQEFGPDRGERLSRLPARLPQQPIVYPVLNEEYASQIARDWNTTDPASGYRGYVTRFAVRRAFLAGYPIQRAGGRIHEEYWIPAADLPAFNANIVGPIEVTTSFGAGAPQ